MPEAVDGTLVRLPFDFNPTAKGCGSLSSRAGRGPALLTNRTNGRLAVSQEVAMPSTFKGTQSNPSHLLYSAILMFCCICSSVWPALIPAATWVRSFSSAPPRGDVFHRAHRSMAGGHELEAGISPLDGRHPFWPSSKSISRFGSRRNEMKSTRNSTLSSGNAMKLESLE